MPPCVKTSHVRGSMKLELKQTATTGLQGCQGYMLFAKALHMDSHVFPEALVKLATSY